MADRRAERARISLAGWLVAILIAAAAILGFFYFDGMALISGYGTADGPAETSGEAETAPQPAD